MGKWSHRGDGAVPGVPEEPASDAQKRFVSTLRQWVERSMTATERGFLEMQGWDTWLSHLSKRQASSHINRAKNEQTHGDEKLRLRRTALAQQARARGFDVQPADVAGVCAACSDGVLFTVRGPQGAKVYCSECTTWGEPPRSTPVFAASGIDPDDLPF